MSTVDPHSKYARQHVEETAFVERNVKFETLMRHVTDKDRASL